MRGGKDGTFMDRRIRFKVFRSATSKGMSSHVAMATAYAVHPFNSNHPCEPSIEAPIRDMARRVAIMLRQPMFGSVIPVEHAVLEALDDYRKRAEAAGDDFYARRFAARAEGARRSRDSEWDSKPR